ncbi:hypothetical protein HPB49_010364 [Dermacentor silvarum]|uniref:Uncharacterized protein n=1 Tax=Dermacentor silvarum TaxID=543639 RepID=A0ACB8CWR1_DERSI|nr:hypothetical protein HPB49_010364 [Dermacentor silvarum]
MASAPESKFLLKGFSDVLDGRLIQFADQPPAGLLGLRMKLHRQPERHAGSRPRLPRGDLGFCSRRLPRSLLVSHVEAAHSATAKSSSTKSRRHKDMEGAQCRHVEAAHLITAKSSSAKSKRHKETAIPSTEVSSGPLVKGGDRKVQPESTVKSEEPVATKAATTVTELSHEHIQDLIEATASRTASVAVENVIQLNGTLFRDILGAVNLIYERLTAVTRTAGVSFTASSSVEDATAAPAVFEHRPKEKHLEEFTWMVCRYSKLRVGIHYVESPLLLIAPGHRVQFTVCIDGITVVELSVSVMVHRGDHGGQPCAQPFQRTCPFTLLDKSGNGAHVTSLFRPKDLFDSDAAVSPSTEDAFLVSGWLTISKISPDPSDLRISTQPLAEGMAVRSTLSEASLIETKASTTCEVIIIEDLPVREKVLDAYRRSKNIPNYHDKRPQETCKKADAQATISFKADDPCSTFW